MAKAPYLDIYAKTVATGKATSFETSFEYMGKYFFVSVFSTNAHQFAILFQDITDRKNMESQLQQAQKMESIGNLAGGIAHDFNNILFPIVGISELLMDDLPTDSPEYESVQEIFKAGMRGGDLVKQILTFSRQTEHKLIPVHVQQVLKEVLKLSRSTIPMDIDIVSDIQNDCGQVMADPTQLHQIAMNLITNAYHAVEPTGGKIYVRFQKTVLESTDQAAMALEPGEYALLTVADTGIGIDPVIMDKIFDPYFTTKDKGKGTGLGLSVVHGIVKEHGGDIKVDSTPGKGAVFSVYLPVMEIGSEAESVDKLKILPTGHERILLVDDEEPIVKLEKQMLGRLGYQVAGRTGSIDALAAFTANPDGYDLIISDMNMPGMTGIQLAGKAISIRSDIPVIICTGFSERITRKKSERMGIKGLLMKPVAMADLAHLVRNVIDGVKNSC
jgi:signal transduction histidine kinase/ActR/RegA family two-component response regulator